MFSRKKKQVALKQKEPVSVEDHKSESIVTADTVETHLHVTSQNLRASKQVCYLIS